MKKRFSVLFTLFFLTDLFCQTVPSQFLGIWEGKDRFVFFEQNENLNNQELVLLLKEYYGWYVDRTAEPKEYSDKTERPRNAGTTKEPLSVNYSFTEIKSTDKSWSGYINLSYSRSQNNIIPVCIIDGKMYLSFFVQDEKKTYFYRGEMVSNGITVDSQEIPENIIGFILDEGNLFNVRYWKTDMEYSSDDVNFIYGDKTYLIPKHIKSGNEVYTCVNGKSKKVRNVQPPQIFNESDFVWNDDKTIFTKVKEEYLYRLNDHKDYEDLMQIVKAANSRRKPNPPPLFPQDNLED